LKQYLLSSVNDRTVGSAIIFVEEKCKLIFIPDQIFGLQAGPERIHYSLYMNRFNVCIY